MSDEIFMKTRSGFVAQQCTFSFCLMVHRFVPQKEVTEIEAHPHTIQQICLCLTNSLFSRVRMKFKWKFLMRYKTSTRMRLSQGDNCESLTRMLSAIKREVF